MQLKPELRSSRADRRKAERTIIDINWNPHNSVAKRKSLSETLRPVFSI